MSKKITIIYAIATIILLLGMKLIISGVFASMAAATQSLF